MWQIESRQFFAHMSSLRMREGRRQTLWLGDLSDWSGAHGPAFTCNTFAQWVNFIRDACKAFSKLGSVLMEDDGPSREGGSVQVPSRLVN